MEAPSVGNDVNGERSARDNLKKRKRRDDGTKNEKGISERTARKRRRVDFDGRDGCGGVFERRVRRRLGANFDGDRKKRSGFALGFDSTERKI